MRSILRAGLLAATVLAAGPVPAARAADTVTVCDNLVTLRRLMMPEVSQDPDEPAPPPDRTGCREVAPGAIGEPERRTMIGGAPYECRSIENGPCLWVRP